MITRADQQTGRKVKNKENRRKAEAAEMSNQKCLCSSQCTRNCVHISATSDESVSSIPCGFYHKTLFPEVTNALQTKRTTYNKAVISSLHNQVDYLIITFSLIQLEKNNNTRQVQNMYIFSSTKVSLHFNHPIAFFILGYLRGVFPSSYQRISTN